jgi:hypothetical protein
MLGSAAIYWPSVDELIALAASRWQHAYASLLADVDGWISSGTLQQRRLVAMFHTHNVSSAPRESAVEARI